MIDRLIHEDWQLIFPLVALIVAALVYAAAAWRGRAATRSYPAKRGTGLEPIW